MAIPSGSGTEVLKRATANGDYNTETTILTVATDHIYTILSISFTETQSQNELFWFSMTDASRSNEQIYIIRSQVLNSNQTFILNDKFVLSSGDTLKLQSGDTSNIDVLISYIDQDWS